MNYDKCDPRSCAYPSRSARGLTKREYFAAMAMQGMLVNFSEQYSKHWTIEEQEKIQQRDREGVAEKSCAFADALLKALSAEDKG